MRSDVIEEQAADWLFRKEEPSWSEADEGALGDWLEESFAHKAAYWRLEHGWHSADRLRAYHRSMPSGRDRNRYAVWGAALAALFLLVVMIGHSWITRSGPQVASIAYATQTGGRRVVALGDGSTLELNTATALRTVVRPDRREVWLDSGEAYFNIAHHAMPFVVHAGRQTITDLGTRFSVRRDGERVTVSVLEGRVRVENHDRGEAARAAIITAGDVAIAQGDATLLAPRSEQQVADSLAWRAGMLRFDHTAVRAAAAEFNRYNRQQIEVTDRSAANTEIGGAFPANDPLAFTQLMQDAYGFRATTREGRIILSR